MALLVPYVLVFLLLWINSSYAEQQPLVVGLGKDWRTRSIYQILTDRFATTERRSERCRNLYDYCGGTFEGIRKNLDWIQKMGFNAIWISPFPENTDHGYHGYWAKDLYKVNPYFGTKLELHRLIKECHERDIWVMFDVVANHMGNTLDEFGRFYPFDDESHYHRYCLIRNYNNQREVEYCRIGDAQSSLADLDTENPQVVEKLNEWIRWVVTEFQLDGIRIDTVKHVRKDFWTGFTKAAGVFSIGEILHGDPIYVGEYQRYMDSVLNFPLYFTMRDVFQYRNSMWNLEMRWEQNRQYFRDLSVLGNFIDNHDVERFLHRQNDPALFWNALAYTLLAEGIPILYQGTELMFAGGDDPKNRESMWPDLYRFVDALPDIFSDPWNATHPEHVLKFNQRSRFSYSYGNDDLVRTTLRLIRTMNQLRQKAGPSLYHANQRHVWTQDDLHVFLRGDVLVVLTNGGQSRSGSRMIRIPQRRKFVNILDTTEELEYRGEDAGQFNVEIRLRDGRPKIFYPKEKWFL